MLHDTQKESPADIVVGSSIAILRTLGSQLWQSGSLEQFALGAFDIDFQQIDIFTLNPIRRTR